MRGNYVSSVNWRELVAAAWVTALIALHLRALVQAMLG